MIQVQLTKRMRSLVLWQWRIWYSPGGRGIVAGASAGDSSSAGAVFCRSRRGSGSVGCSRLNSCSGGWVPSCISNHVSPVQTSPSGGVGLVSPNIFHDFFCASFKNHLRLSPRLDVLDQEWQLGVRVHGLEEFFAGFHMNLNPKIA